MSLNTDQNQLKSHPQNQSPKQSDKAEQHPHEADSKQSDENQNKHAPKQSQSQPLNLLAMVDSSPTARKLFSSSSHPQKRPKQTNPDAEMFADLRKLPPPRVRTPEPARIVPEPEDDSALLSGSGSGSGSASASGLGSGSGEVLSEEEAHVHEERDLPSSPSSPGALPAFDWDDFEVRYERALKEADDKEREILEEFDRVAQYFSVWASMSAAVDNDRATKRLQTRERFVSLSEKRTAEKQEHHDRVLRAFQSALALLGTQ